MARYPKEATYRTFVIDSKTGKWKQIDPKDIPQEKIDELCDKFALGAGYKRAEEPLRWLCGQAKGEKQMRNKVFTAGVAVMAIGAMAMDSIGIGGVIAAIMVIAGAVITFAAYTLERLEKERLETERRIQQLRKAS